MADRIDSITFTSVSHLNPIKVRKAGTWSRLDNWTGCEKSPPQRLEAWTSGLELSFLNNMSYEMNELHA